MKRKDIIKQSIGRSLKSKEQILDDILNVVRHEEKEERKNYDVCILVLSLIQRKDMHGYSVIKEMEIKSKGLFTMNEGDVYPVLHKLENMKCIESYWIYEEGFHRRYYKITGAGRKYLESKKEEVKNLDWNINLGNITKFKLAYSE